VELARSVMTGSGPAADRESALAALDLWSTPRAETVERARRTVDQIEHAGGDWTFAKLTLANAALRQAAG
jgi:glutamate dehydrogenase